VLVVGGGSVVGDAVVHRLHRGGGLEVVAADSIEPTAPVPYEFVPADEPVAVRTALREHLFQPHGPGAAVVLCCPAGVVDACTQTVLEVPRTIPIVAVVSDNDEISSVVEERATVIRHRALDAVVPDSRGGVSPEEALGPIEPYVVASDVLDALRDAADALHNTARVGWATGA
jgi:nucleoside-diphosphate-sugar epimerase